jgi:hypothetical protein
MGASYIDQLIIPTPPPQVTIDNIGEQIGVNNQQNQFNRRMSSFMDDLYNILHNGYLVRSLRIESIGAEKLVAGTIVVDSIFLSNGKFELDGVLGQIRIKDDQAPPVTIIEIGEFASGTDWGIKVRDSDGSIKFQALSNAGVFLDGAVILNSTLVNATLVNETIETGKIKPLNITESLLGAGAVTNLKIGTGAVDTLQLATDAVDTVKIKDASIETVKIKADAVTSFKRQSLATATFLNIQPGTLNDHFAFRSAIKNHDHSEDGPVCMAYIVTDNFTTTGSPTADTKVTLATYMVTNNASTVGTVVSMGSHASSQNFTGLDADLTYYFW